MLQETKFLIVFILSIVAGIGIEDAIDYAYGIDWKNATPVDFYIGITSLFSGYMIFFLFLVLSMFLSLILTVIPYFASKFPNSKYVPKIKNTSVIPIIRGVTFGFGIMIIYHLFTKGIPKLFG
ncbi:MAG: hypothetical protein ACREAD_04250 [Nitrosopumilaceae archaeon]